MTNKKHKNGNICCEGCYKLGISDRNVEIRLEKKELLINLFNKLKKCGNLTTKEYPENAEEELKLIRTNQYLDIIEQYFCEEIEELGFNKIGEDGINSIL